MTKFTKTALASLFTFSAAGASAAAFQLAEVSTSGLGMAYAGNAAVANDASVVATNPALMTKFKQIEISAGGIYVDSAIDVSGKFTPSGIDASHKNIVPNAIVPNAYIVAPINERFSVGGGVNVNYGLKSEFNSNYSAGFFGGRTDLSAVNVNLSGAYNLGYGFSIGVGINAVHAKATLERYLGSAALRLQSVLAANKTTLDTATAGLQQLEAGIAQAQAAQNNQVVAALTQRKDQVLSSLNARLAQAGINRQITSSAQLNALVTGVSSLKAQDTIHKLKGDKWGFGWNVGLLYEINENNRLGIAYHSPVKLNFKGKYSNTVALPIPNMVDTVTGGATIPGSLSLTLPSFWEVSGYHKLTEKLAMQYSYKRTDWSSFKSLDAYGANGNKLFHKTENFNDASRIALGFSYDVNEALTLRTGVAYDESASVTNPSISIPDTDRTWYSFGATYRFTPNLSADLGYSHLRGSKNQFNEEGRADFKVKAKANLYGLNVNYKF
ncbi:outer membrane protein transport protein [Ursidibacter maritimus]|uniref:Outer membrane protein transport protein n=1 Tax=Ursidibacter maritimus TaxID=1331689 RepID=A0A949T5N2_9PAST|nr:outer membrane protein transport protein [Ursidibacter maritimus]MBV6523759.1 outer membrane protein transport protein [Ursidibacter maritimus]MBV6526614.1 outer membrane protein transport protein [Ursidibacter maritimus]MBV6527953.1 outer membrane protein transport protein [Ursidibacter maritimus]MBV6528892.1 outer membrane protein transport protein [Ursidibacter maritimus]MBV6531758.1 outer membrane protein transport protein [Ursidibacter maritimus]